LVEAQSNLIPRGNTEAALNGAASFFMPFYSGLSKGVGTITKLPQLAHSPSRWYQDSS
jgi:hypothetical protein